MAAPKLEPVKNARARYTFNIPKGIGGDEYQKVTLVHLEADDELMASKRAQSDPMKLAFELAKQSIVAVNDRQLSLVDGSVDTFFAKAPPKIRNLIMSAYAKMHNPADDEMDDFLKSQQVTVA